MASSSGEGSSGGDGNDRRYQQSLQGLLQFSAEHSAASGSTTNTVAVLDPQKSPRPTSNNDNVNDPELARTNQDRALQVLGLHRYRIAGDGNCLFRAVSQQLNLDQDRFHPMLRKAAVKWMRDNYKELLDWGLLDGENEIAETEKPGAWPGQAAIVALANILGINIALIQGGDKGDIDIQHICPFETPIDKEQGSIILAYLYNGHYDAVVEEANIANPEFEAWTLRRNKEYEADEALARKLAEEDLPGNEPVVKNSEEELARQLADNASEQLAKQLAAEEYEAALAASATEDTPKGNDPGCRHVSEVKVNYSRPTETRTRTSPGVARTHHISVVNSSGETHTIKPSIGYTSPESERSVITDFSPRTKTPSPVYRAEHRPTPPPRSKPIRSYSEDDAPTLKLTLYPRHSPIERDVKPTHHRNLTDSDEFRVTRQIPTNNALRERQIYDNIPTTKAHASQVHKTSPSPTVRVIPIQRSTQEKGDDNLERRAAVRRRDYANQGSSSSWSHSTELSRNLHSEADRDTYRKAPSYDQNTYHKSSNVPHTRVYTLTEDPANNTDVYNKYSSTADRDTYKRGPTVPHTRVYSLADDRSGHLDTTSRLQREVPRSRPQTVQKSRDIPVMVLSSPLTQLPSHSRATPAPVTYDLQKSSQRPPQLEPFKRSFDQGLLERSLRRRDYWL